MRRPKCHTARNLPLWVALQKVSNDQPTQTMTDQINWHTRFFMFGQPAVQPAAMVGKIMRDAKIPKPVTLIAKFGEFFGKRSHRPGMHMQTMNKDDKRFGLAFYHKAFCIYDLYL